MGIERLLGLIGTGSLPPCRLSDHHFVNFDAHVNPGLCGMVPTGARFAHGFNYANTGLGMPCPDELVNGWPDLS